MAQHDIVLILHLGSPVGVDVLSDELPDLWPPPQLLTTLTLVRLCFLL